MSLIELIRGHNTIFQKGVTAIHQVTVTNLAYHLGLAIEETRNAGIVAGLRADGNDVAYVPEQQAGVSEKFLC